MWKLDDIADVIIVIASVIIIFSTTIVIFSAIVVIFILVIIIFILVITIRMDESPIPPRSRAATPRVSDELANLGKSSSSSSSS